VGAYGGKRQIMEMMAPAGPVYQAGTLSGNPLAMTAGIETLKVLSKPEVYHQLEARSLNLEKGIAKAATKTNIMLHISRVASLLTVFFTAKTVTDYEAAKATDQTLFGRFFRQLLSAGMYWAPSQFEAAFISLAHSDKDIQTTIATIDRVLSSLQEEKDRGQG
jgi:glutamate-1-semialdehyde 2,1-aminomutase